MTIDLAINRALDGFSNEECVQVLFDSIPDKMKSGDSDRLAKHLELLISTFAFKVYPIREIGSTECDRLLLKFINRSAALRLIRHEKKQADEFGQALDELGIPRDKAFMVLADCRHVLEDEISG